tara:strand:- start:128 stop:430 length:303 start_codon:yes stop_codon:yes gene_type:complete
LNLFQIKNTFYFSSIFITFGHRLLDFGSVLFISKLNQKLGAYLLLTFIVPTTFIFHFSPFQIKDVLINDSLIVGLFLGLNNTKDKSLKELFNNQTNNQKS